MPIHAIIGGANGLGGATARLLCEQGHRVWLADGPAQEAHSLQAGAQFWPMDLADADGPAAFMARIAQDGDGLASLVVAASSAASAPLPEWTVAAWDEACAINLRLPFLAAQAALPLLVPSRGNIVLLSSTATLRGQADSHAYQAGKAGLAGLLRSLTAELGPQGVRVNLVLAGWLDTPLTHAYWAAHPDADAAKTAINARIPLQRHGSAAEVAAAIAWLTSDAASYISGAMIPLDGGDTAV